MIHVRKMLMKTFNLFYLEGLTIPVVQFTEPGQAVKEASGKIVVPIERTGNVSQESTVICYTVDGTASADMDYLPRANSPESTVEFVSGKFLYLNICFSLYPQFWRYFTLFWVQPQTPANGESSAWESWALGVIMVWRSKSL